MSSRDLPRVRIAARPLHPVLIWIPLTCFIGALLTDLAYWQSAEMMWADFSAWLVSVGVLLACLAAILGLIELWAGRYLGTRGSVWLYVIGNIVALVLAIFDALIHTRDAWTSVVPWGLVLSAATVVVLLVTTVFGLATFYRWRTEVAA
jgi:uncharacterized membrane protein